METSPRFASRRIRPIVALKAFRRLIRDPEDTHQVFMIGEALRGNSLARVTTRFLATPLGPEVITGRHKLLPILADREALACLPAGSLGRAYLDFVIAESLSAQGLAEAARRRDEMSEASAEEKAFRVHLRDSHDLWHVLTGYGRDPLGEVCLLAFTYAQTGLNGLGLISFVGSLRIARELRGHPVRAAVREGRAMGRAAHWLPAIDWSTLLPRDLGQVRAELGFRAPETYRAIGRALKPKKLGQAAAIAQ